MDQELCQQRSKHLVIISFYEVGYRLGDKSGSYSSKEGLKYLEKYATQLGLNKQSGIELDESSPQVSDETSVRSAIDRT